MRLRNQRISVLRFWEHEVSDSLSLCVEKTLKRLAFRRRQLFRKQETT
jgi:hypothetical protein